MRQHEYVSVELLRRIDFLAPVAPSIEADHGATGADASAPMESRIIAVADAYNAMTSDRPYRDAMPSRVARLRLAQAVDSQFDTAIVAAFEAILAGAAEDYRLARRRDFGEFAQSSNSDDDESRVAAVA